jgi:large subunit ribosomal protein L29
MQRKKMTMEFEKISNMTDDELPAQLTKSAEQLFRIRFQKSLGNNEGVKKLRELKLDVARIHTVTRERALALAQNAAPASPAKAAASTRTERKKATKD